MATSNPFFEFITPTIAVAAAALYYTWLLTGSFNKYFNRLGSLPPGPRRKWITGNLHQMPRERIWTTVQEWSKIYGPLVYVRLLTKEIVFLNDQKSVAEILDVNATSTSGRPVHYMTGELGERKQSVFMTQGTDPKFRTYRTLLQDGLNPRAVESYRVIQTKEMEVLLKALLEAPEDFVAHIRRNSVAVIMKIAYGYQVTENNDPFVHIIEDAFQIVRNLSVQGKYWVEFLPILRFLPEWLPGASFKRTAKVASRLLHRTEEAPYEWAKENIRGGNHIESFTSKYLTNEHGELADTETQDAIKWTSAGLYTGGGDTTVSVMTTFFFLMALYPEVQMKAQKEIDNFVTDRLLTSDDFDALPYNGAIVKEVLRWGPVVPLGLFHSASEDVLYEGHLIPKGATLIPNIWQEYRFTSIWAITHDEAIYPKADVFDPSRHLGDNPQPDPARFVFGYGRRICPGAHLAQNSLFLNMVNVLALFKISKPLDETGREYTPPAEWVSGVTMHLKPFNCQVRLRSGEKLSLLPQWENTG
ncbi:cytochrome P450 [Crepidotus variabilis]|uniref:Cytochrome P450 n=1 Tax=Crepidotus variabilis TaxID=179855 RepID=A0A9P6EFU7_9AGAR|nr:cytochrome P450 [Crepidotus variabilis]